MTTLLLLLLACGRPSTDADVRMVGVGNDPETIGPSPTPYGGIVEYAMVDFAGGGLNLGHMGLGSMDEVGPQMIQFAPPYEAVIGFSYIFDNRLPAGDTFSFVAPIPPVAPGTCYTVVEPQGPIGSFTTVDLGDYMEFASDDGQSQFRMSRNPGDYPPDARDLSVYYLSFDEHAPTPRTHLVAGDDPTDPSQMTSEIYRHANFPYGQDVSFRFPGAVARIDQPVGSIPRPSSAVGDQRVRLPSELGGVLVEWMGDAGAQSTCLDYYSAGREAPPTLPTDCDVRGPLPEGIDEFDSFPGQVYPGPWDTQDGKVTFSWTPASNGDFVSIALRFMAPIDSTDPANMVARKDGREPLACDAGDDDLVYIEDPSIVDEDGAFLPAAKGDPYSRMVEVSCLADESSGQFVLDTEMLADAMEYVDAHPAGGVIFYFSRGVDNEVEVPAVKDPYEQRREISPIKVATRHTRIGRMVWEDGGAE